MAKTTFRSDLFDGPLIEAGILPIERGRQFMLHVTFGEPPVAVVAESVVDELSAARGLERVVFLKAAAPAAKGPGK